MDNIEIVLFFFLPYFLCFPKSPSKPDSFLSTDPIVMANQCWRWWSSFSPLPHGWTNDWSIQLCLLIGHRWGELYIFPEKAAFPSKVEWHVFVHLAAELKSFVHFPSESSIGHFFVSQDFMYQLELRRLRVWIILYKCAWHLAGCGKYLSPYLGTRIYFHEIINYLSDRMGSGEKRWWVIAFIKEIWKVTLWEIFSYTHTSLE